jgi:hypothetical protein
VREIRIHRQGNPLGLIELQPIRLHRHLIFIPVIRRQFGVLFTSHEVYRLNLTDPSQNSKQFLVTSQRKQFSLEAVEVVPQVDFCLRAIHPILLFQMILSMVQHMQLHISSSIRKPLKWV